MDISCLAYDSEGMKRVYENEKWTVGIKNWRPSNDMEQIDGLERHNQTDELFVLLEGQCALIYAHPEGSELTFQAIKMEALKVYCIPCSLWHNTITSRNAKLLLIEDSSTGMGNSELLSLSHDQVDAVRALAKKLLDA